MRKLNVVETNIKDLLDVAEKAAQTIWQQELGHTNPIKPVKVVRDEAFYTNSPAQLDYGGNENRSDETLELSSESCIVVHLQTDTGTTCLVTFRLDDNNDKYIAKYVTLEINRGSTSGSRTFKL